jgi:hypothetical protein
MQGADRYYWHSFETVREIAMDLDLDLIRMSCFDHFGFEMKPTQIRVPAQASFNRAAGLPFAIGSM